MINFRAFSDELQKIASRDSEELYEPGVVAHEAGHARLHGHRGVTAVRRRVPQAAQIYGAGRLIGQAAGMSGMGPAEFAAVSAAANVPVLADEFGSTAVGLKALKDEGKMTKDDWKRTALQLAAVNSSYLSAPMIDVATLAAARSGLHPVGQLAMQVASKPVAQRAWSALGALVPGPKVDAKRAREIVEATAPGTPVFASKTPVPGGSYYVPPARDDERTKEEIAAVFSGTMRERDIKKLQERGGVLLSPLDAKTNAVGLGSDAPVPRFSEIK